MKNAYGATEFPGIAVNGEINDAVDLELVDVPDMGYRASDKPYPRGEIRVRHKGGIKPLSGYWNNDEETSKVRLSPFLCEQARVFGSSHACGCELVTRVFPLSAGVSSRMVLHW